MRAPEKPLLVMLMSHDPSADPRVDWEASYASSRFQVVAIGLQPQPGGRPPEESKRGYRLRRLPVRRGVGTTLRFAGYWLQAIGWRDRLALAALFVLGGWLL